MKRPAVLILLFVVSVAAEAGTLPQVGRETGSEFVDHTNKFKITMYGDWAGQTYSDEAGREKTDFVDIDRRFGLLKVSKEALGSKSVAEFIKEEEEGLKVYKASYEPNAKESFGGGALKGMLLSFFFVEGGQKKAGAYYFLQDKEIVWQLRFTGKRGKLDLNRNTIDRIARSFTPF